MPANQSTRLLTELSSAIRRIASPTKGAIGRMRMRSEASAASVGRIVSVITSSLRLDPLIRATAPPDNTPWVI